MENRDERRMTKIVAFKDRNDDAPPDDDVCPICFGEFTLPCKSSCGHWFCASCFLQLWKHRKPFQLCKCPMCFRLVGKLSPQPSLLTRQEAEVVQVLKNIEQYNDLYLGRGRALGMKIIALVDIVKRVFQEDGFFIGKMFCLVLRLIVEVLKVLYMLDYVSTEVMETLAFYDAVGAALLFMIMLVVLVAFCIRIALRNRARRLAARQ